MYKLDGKAKEYYNKISTKVNSCKTQVEVRQIIKNELAIITDLAISFSVEEEDYMMAKKLKNIKDKRI